MLQIAGKRCGEPSEPLEELTLLGADVGEVVVRDGLGREYFRAAAAPQTPFRVGGALGQHTVERLSLAGAVLQTLRFPVTARTHLEEESGQFAQLLTLLHATMLRFSEVGMTLWNGKIYQFFVGWLRDHVHTLEGMKYFHGELKSAIDLYRDSQRDDEGEKVSG